MFAKQHTTMIKQQHSSNGSLPSKNLVIIQVMHPQAAAAQFVQGKKLCTIVISNCTMGQLHISWMEIFNAFHDLMIHIDISSSSLQLSSFVIL